MVLEAAVALTLLLLVPGRPAAEVAPQEVCVQEHSPLQVSCTPPHGHSCVWTDASGTDYTMEDISAKKVAGIKATDGGNPCDVTVHDVTGDKWRTANCSAVLGNDTLLLGAFNVNVVKPPELPAVAEGDSTLDVSTSHFTFIACHVRDANVAITWMLGGNNISQHAEVSQKEATTWSHLHHLFGPGSQHSRLRCCRSACRKRFCATAKIRTLHKAQGFYSEYPKGRGVVVRFRSNPAPSTVTWGLAPSCDEPPTPLDPSTDGNVSTTLLNHTDGWFSANLVVSPANSSLGEEKLLLTVTQSEGNSTHCTTYYKIGLSSGAIVGISVSVITTVVLVSLALFIHYRSRGENYQQ